MSSIPAQLLVQVILILVNAFFAATELAVITLSTAKLRHMTENGDKGAAKLLKLAEEPSNFLSTIQVGITLAGYLGSAFAAENFSGYLTTWLYDTLGFQLLPRSAVSLISIILITIILAYFTLILGELVPKRIAMQRPYQVAKFSCQVVSGIAVVMRPVVWFLSISTNGVLRLLRMKTQAEEESVTEEEIRMMVDLGGENGAIDEDEQEWIQNVFEFGDLSVHEAMTHRGDVTALSIDDDNESILQAIRTSGLSRFPVYRGNIDTVEGVLSTRDFLLNLTSPQPKPLAELLRAPFFVPESLHADKLFEEMQRKKVHFAVVVDEYGGTEGIVTLEDLLEEIVGNIYDETDPTEAPEAEQLGENLWRISGSMSVEELSELLEVDLPESDDYNTLAGLLVTHLNAIPKDGDSPELREYGLHFQVEHTADHHIESVLIQKLLPTPPPEDQEPESQAQQK